MSRLLNVADVAAMTSLSIPSIYRYTSKRLIPHIKIGGKVIFEEEKVKEWLLSHYVEVTNE